MEISHSHLLNRPAYPSNMVFKKMENLIKRMQDQVGGVTVKPQKLFLTIISNAFTGESLIIWMIKNLDIKDADEALHLANMLCKYGYFFQVTGNNITTVKDGELYRFQAPYFWVSTNWNAGNTDYAIYLVKRTMRNQEKHGLNDYELQALEDLKKKLTHQWDFIRLQADAQIRALKDMKKADKAFIDSQERAFWNIIRPEYEVSILNEDMRGNIVQGSKKIIRKEDFYKKKIIFLKALLKNRIRTKSSSTLAVFCGYSELYYDYDGLISHCQPSNPWITDDTTMWEHNSPLVENLTNLRVKRWSFSFKELLNDPTGVQEFTKYCETEFSAENLRFYVAVQSVKGCPTSELSPLINRIYKEHLSADGGNEVNVNDGIRNKITNNLNKPSRDIFFEAEKHIFELMKKNSYQRFIISDFYKNLLEKVIIPAPKKSRIFHFVTRDYFRYRDESSDESDSVEDQEENGDFVAGGIYAPPILPSEPTEGLKLAIENGIKEFEKLEDKK